MQKPKRLLLICVLTLLNAVTAQAQSLGVAPSVPDWPADLPAALEVEGGLLLPDPLDDAILERLIFLDGYPELCQVSIDAWGDYVAAEWTAKLDVELAKRDAAELEREASASPWRWYHVAGGIAGGLLLGMGAGYVAGAF